ncbi:MAG: hypothetical protein QXH80_03035 [Candidatus Nanoarchaeia archaeon]
MKKITRKRKTKVEKDITTTDCTAIIPLDSQKILSEYHKKYLKIKREFQKAKSELDSHEKEEIPAFQRWLRNLLLPKVEELKSIEEKLIRISDTLDRLHEMWKKKKWASRFACYQAFIEQKDTAKNEDENEQDEQNDKDNQKSSDKWYTGEDYYERDGDKNNGKHKNKFNDPFEDLKAFLKFMLGEDFAAFEEDENFFENFFNKPKTNTKTEKKLKDVYRTICKMLHPDTGVEFDADTSELWHEAQIAYQNKDIDRLEQILAVGELKSSLSKRSPTCSQILSAIKHYEKGKSAIMAKIRKLKKNEEWGFLSWSDRKKEQKSAKFQENLEFEIFFMKSKLQKYKEELEKWQKEPIKKIKRTVPKVPKQENFSSGAQLTFEF